MLMCVSCPSYNMLFNQWRVSGKWTGISRLKAYHTSRGYACGRYSEQCPYTNLAKCLVRWEHEFDIICVQENEHFEKSLSLKKVSSVNYQANWYSPRRSLFYRWKSWKWEFTQFAPNHCLPVTCPYSAMLRGEEMIIWENVETNKGKAMPSDDRSCAVSWLAKDLIPEGCW